MKNSQDIGLPKCLLKKKETFFKLKTFLKKGIAFRKELCYDNSCCDMIALKREVATLHICRFSVERMSS
ncbi:MAG: hypothetical protein ACLU1S_03325 [Eubacterium sp.]